MRRGERGGKREREKTVVTTVTVAWQELRAGALRPRVGQLRLGTPRAWATPEWVGGLWRACAVARALV